MFLVFIPIMQIKNKILFHVYTHNKNKKIKFYLVQTVIKYIIFDLRLFTGSLTRYNVLTG